MTRGIKGMCFAKQQIYAAAAALFFTLLIPILNATAADATEDAVGIAIGQIDRAIATVRKTGSLAGVIPDLERSRLTLENAHKELTTQGRDADAAYAMMRAADCLRIQSRWAEAKASYKVAIEQARLARNAEYEGKAWLGLERAERIGLRNHGEATAAIQTAMQLIEKASLPRTLYIDVLGERAELALSDGSVGDALVDIENAIEAAEKIQDSTRVWQGLTTRSAIHHWAATALVEQYNTLPYLTTAEWNSCKTLADSVRKSIDQALFDTKRAAELSEKLGYTSIAEQTRKDVPLLTVMAQVFEQGVALREKARVHYMQTQRETSATDQLQTNALVTMGGKPIPTGLLDTNGAASNPEMQMYIRYIQSELKKEQPVVVTSWRNRFTEGRTLEATQDVEAAVQAYRDAAQLVESERLSVPDEVTRSSFIAEKTELYYRLVLTLLDRKEFAEAFQWMERFRGREMADMVSSLNLRLPTQKERDMYSRWSTARSELSAQKALGKGADTRSYEAVLHEIQTQAPQLFDLIEPHSVTLDDLRRAMQASPFDLVYYILANGRVVLWHIGPKIVDAKAYIAPESELRRLCTGILRDLSNGGSFQLEAAQTLHLFLAQPVIEMMETKHLVIVPPPGFQSFPFQVLVDKQSKRFFDEEASLSYSPSASLAVRLRPSTQLVSPNVLAVIGPGLEFGDRDAADIAALYPNTTVLHGSAATFSALSRESAGRAVIHVAAHGKYNENSPMLSTVELSGGSGTQELTTAAQMMTLPLRDVEIVSLGACSAGRVGVNPSNEIFGFARSLFYAGAQSLVLPLWEVDDEAAVFWFKSFYAEARSHSLPEAAALANATLRQDPLFGSNPRYWAAYMFIGR